MRGKETCLTLQWLRVIHQEDVSVPIVMQDPRSEVTQASLPPSHG